MEFRVLHCIGSMNRGGAETFIMNVYRSLDRSKLQFDFLLNSKDSDFAEEIHSLGGKIYVIPPRREGILKYYKSLDGFFRIHRNEYKVVHQHVSSLSSIEPLLFAHKYGIPIRIIHAHSTAQKGSKFHYALHFFNKVRIGRIANRYLACSDLALKWLYGGTAVYSKAIIINNGIDTSVFKFDLSRRIEIRQGLELSEKLVLGHVGRFCKVKNHKFLVDVFFQLLKIKSNAHLLLVGTGELQEKIEEYVLSLGIEKKVSFLGLRKDTADLLLAMDVFVFPSLYEGLPVALVEAQASGLIVYCSDRISKNSKISENLVFLPIEKGASYWADYINRSIKNFERSDVTDQVTRANFDIKSIADFMLQNVYE